MPVDWSCTSLNKIADINPKPIKLDSDDIEVSFVGMTDVSESAKLMNTTNRLYGEVKKGFTSFQDNDVLVAKITPCFENGKGALISNLTNGTGFGSTEFHVIRAKEQKGCPEFIHHITTTHNFRVKGEMNMTGTAGQKRVGRDFIASYLIACPPFVEQQKIAKVLSTVDKKIDLIDQKIEETEKLKTGIMQKLFSEGIGVQDENGDWQPHTEFQNSPFGKIPRAWKYAPVKSLVSIKSPKYDPKIKTESLPCIELEHLSQGSGEILGTVNSLELASTKNCFAKGDVLFGKLRPYLKKFAKPNFNGVCSSEIWVMKTTDNKVLHNDFWFYFIQSERFINEANKSCGTKMPRADWKVVSELILPIPSFCEQLGIAKILECVDAKLGLLKQQKAETQRLKKGLMQKLLTGEWRVPVEETEAA
ncbi:restriction endonuclease subunit S [Shewanella algae]|uniref:restriction endonuclease subunit S n=1 Tax=Shewanella algae TaxID=38313 RepID=UPI0030C7CC62